MATWNVGGKAPDNGLNLDDFLRVEDQSDIYVIGYVYFLTTNISDIYFLFLTCLTCCRYIFL